MDEVLDTQWHARLYVWTARKWLEFRNKDPDRMWYDGPRYDLHNTNVCTYVRTLVLYLPTLLLAHAALIFGTLYVGVYFPLAYFGFGSVLLVIAVMLAILTAIAAVLFAIYFSVAYMRRHPPKTPKPPGFIALLRKRSHDFHDNICSPIKVKAKVDHD